MVKARKTPVKNNKKRSMDSVVLQSIEKRRSVGGSGTLRRTRSVRASLKQIGSRWLMAKDKNINPRADTNNDTKENEFSGEHGNNLLGANMTNLKNIERASDFCPRNNEFFPVTETEEYSETVIVEKETKNNIKNEKIEKHHHHHHTHHIHLLDFLSYKHKEKNVEIKSHLTETPADIPPKAAAILQIPTRDHAEQNGDVERRRMMSPEAKSQSLTRNDGFIRNSMRLSSKRRNTLWNNYASTSKLSSIEFGANMAAPPTVLPTAGSKTTKKQAKLLQQRLDRLARINIHLHALFAAIEHGQVDKARAILEGTDVDVNSVNADGLAPLDVAALAGDRILCRLLTNRGAREGRQFDSVESLQNHLAGLLSEAEIRLQELGAASVSGDVPSGPRASFSSIMSSAYPSSAMTGCAGGGDIDKQVGLWGRRARGLQKLVLGLNQARPPDPPQQVSLDITGTGAVSVVVCESMDPDLPIVTKFKVQWSSKSDFSIICGEHELLDLQNTVCHITDLNSNLRYYFRAACGNLKGYGNFKLSSPASCIPSSWRDVDNREIRFDNQLGILDDLFTAVKSARPEDASELSSIDSIASQARRNQKKKTTIKQLFTAASKFQKNLRRGIFLACILYHEDKVLVTNEDFLPVIEVDETYPSCINTDYHWLMKVACTWEDVRALRTDMERGAGGAGTTHFRARLLAAAAHMQSALCITDLGQLHHRPLKDAHGTMVISTINYIRTPKSVSVLNSRWLPLNKVHKKLSMLSEEHNVGEILMGSIQEQITYHQVSNVKLVKGLYLGYLKMQSSVDLIQVVVPAKTPNVLPHCKVRDNPHISAEEWNYLKTYQYRSLHKSDSDSSNISTSEQQRIFLDQIRASLKRLFSYMDVSSEDISTHRLYDVEIIELTSDVSFVIVCPSAEMSCSVPGQREILLQRGDLLSLPVQAFEMIHLNTYQTSIIQRYSRLSCVLELDTIVATHLLRGAFSSSEVTAAKERLATLNNLQTQLNGVWKTVRWLMDVITFTRDRTTCNNFSTPTGVPIKQILDMSENDSSDTSNDGFKRTLLQIPACDPKFVKSSPGRGSWPGPAATGCITNGTSLLNTEFSKSEQHLSVAPRDTSSLNLSNSQYLSATSDNETSRKSSLEGCKSKDSDLSDMMSNRLPPSKSEDMLLSMQKPLQNSHRSRSTSIVTSRSNTASPVLNVRPIYSGSSVSINTANTTDTSDSKHSLSSDSDGTSCPIPVSASTPRKKKSTTEYTKKVTNTQLNVDSNMLIKIEPTVNSDSHYLNCYSNLESTSSKSLTNIKSDIEQSQKTFLKPSCPKSNTETSSEDTKLFKTPYLVSKQDTAGSSGMSVRPSSPQPGILQVYAAYDTGLASGTSLKLHVTPRTTAREVVDLVVKQLNMAVVLKGKDGPIYTTDKLKNFCLVAVIGARERCLRDDFKPLQLQNPWKKGRLYVRQKQDVLAALEHSSRHSAFL